MEWLAGLLGLVGSLTATGVSAGIANINFSRQKQVYKYQKFLQLVQMHREDNAIRRRVADLQKAGLSPVLAAGSAAASAGPIRVDAPQQEAPDMGGLAQMGTMMMQAMVAGKQARKIEEETEKIKQQRQLELLNYPFKLENLESKTALLKIEYQLKTIETAIKAIERFQFEKTGISPNAGPLGKSAKEMVMFLNATVNELYKAGGTLSPTLKKKVEDINKNVK